VYRKMPQEFAEDPVEEIPVVYHILSALDLRHRGPNVIACPSCARTLGFDVIGMAAKVEEGLKHFEGKKKMKEKGE